MLLPKHEHVPHHRDFDPMAIVGILPVVTLFERTGGQEWRFRLAGTEIDRRWGRTVTGLTYSELVAPEVAPILRREFEEVVRKPCGSWSVLRVEFTSGKRATLEILRLPLRARDGSVSLILGCGGEVPHHPTYQPEPPRSVTTIVEQRFFDIGAGDTGSVLAQLQSNNR